MVGQCHWEWDWDGVEFMMIENLYIACEMASDASQMTLSRVLFRVRPKMNCPLCHSLVGSREMTRASSSSNFHQFNSGSGNLQFVLEREPFLRLSRNNSCPRNHSIRFGDCMFVYETSPKDVTYMIGNPNLKDKCTSQ